MPQVLAFLLQTTVFLGCSKSLPETILYIPYILYLYNINGMIIIQIIILLLVMALGKQVTHGR